MTNEVQLLGGRISVLLHDDLLLARGVKYANAQRFERSRLLGTWEGKMDYLADVRIAGLPGLQRSSSHVSRPVNCLDTCHHG